MSVATFFTPLANISSGLSKARVPTYAAPAVAPTTDTAMVYDGRNLDSVAIAALALIHNQVKQIVDINSDAHVDKKLTAVIFMGVVPTTAILAQVCDPDSINQITIWTMPVNEAAAQDFKKAYAKHKPTTHVSFAKPAVDDPDNLFAHESSTLLYRWMSQMVDNEQERHSLMNYAAFLSLRQMSVKVPRDGGYKQFYKDQLNNLAHAHHLRQVFSWVVDNGVATAYHQNRYKRCDPEVALQDYMAHYNKVRQSLKAGMRSHMLRHGRQSRVVKVAQLRNAEYIDYLRQLGHVQEDVACYADTADFRLWYIQAGSPTDMAFFTNALKARKVVCHGTYWEFITDLPVTR